MADHSAIAFSAGDPKKFGNRIFFRIFFAQKPTSSPKNISKKIMRGFYSKKCVFNVVEHGLGDLLAKKFWIAGQTVDAILGSSQGVGKNAFFSA